MEQEFFRNLPSELIINILSRLPVEAITICKCTCRSWLQLIETDEFVKSHLSNSAPRLAIHEYGLNSKSYEIYELENNLNLQHHNKLVTDFELPFEGRIHSSANGLLFLRDLSFGIRGLYICNPITHEYIAVKSPPSDFNQTYDHKATYGFGMSTSGQYKVVRISESRCCVYTLGVGCWKRVASDVGQMYYARSVGVFLKGSLHWMVFDQSEVASISCFDLESEQFNDGFSAPSLRCGRTGVGLFALENCLCVCDNWSNYEIVIWVMKEYGVEKSWEKKFVINKVPDFVGKCYEAVYPIKVLKNGDILMAWEDSFLFYYCNETKTCRKIDAFEPKNYIDAVVHVTSFLSLKNFGVKNVMSF